LDASLTGKRTRPCPSAR